MVPIGVLGFDGKQYSFRYLEVAGTDPEFRPLLGFRDLEGLYTSDDLFPLFQERVLDPSRPDFERVIERLDLDPSRATPWEQLVRLGGASEGDTLQVTPFPFDTSAGWQCLALLAGIRYLAKKKVKTRHGVAEQFTAEGLEEHLQSLREGQRLEIEPEIGNTYNQDALLAVTADGIPVGYVPDWLARVMAPRLREGTPIHAVVERLNDAGAGWHLRLLIRFVAAEPLASIEQAINFS